MVHRVWNVSTIGDNSSVRYLMANHLSRGCRVHVAAKKLTWWNKSNKRHAYKTLYGHISCSQLMLSQSQLLQRAQRGQPHRKHLPHRLDTTVVIKCVWPLTLCAELLGALGRRRVFGRGGRLWPGRENSRLQVSPYIKPSISTERLDKSSSIKHIPSLLSLSFLIIHTLPRLRVQNNFPQLPFSSLKRRTKPVHYSHQSTLGFSKVCRLPSFSVKWLLILSRHRFKGGEGGWAAARLTAAASVFNLSSHDAPQTHCSAAGVSLSPHLYLQLCVQWHLCGVFYSPLAFTVGL